LFNRGGKIAISTCRKRGFHSHCIDPSQFTTNYVVFDKCKPKNFINRLCLGNMQALVLSTIAAKWRPKGRACHNLESTTCIFPPLVDELLPLKLAIMFFLYTVYFVTQVWMCSCYHWLHFVVFVNWFIFFSMFKPEFFSMCSTSACSEKQDVFWDLYISKWVDSN
jgi:hypothetical protein